MCLQGWHVQGDSDTAFLVPACWGSGPLKKPPKPGRGDRPQQPGGAGGDRAAVPSPAGVHEARPSPLPAASLLPLHTSQVYLLLIFKFCAARLRSCCCACSCDHEEVPTGSVLTAALPSAPGAKAQEPRGLITRAEGAGACAGPSGRMHLPSFRVGGTAPRACTSQPPGDRKSVV